MRVVPRTSSDSVAAELAWAPLRFEDFYRHERPLLVTLAATLCGPAWADDVAQEAMLVAYRRWSELLDRDHPEAFVRRVCVNLAISAYRRRSRESRATLRLVAQRATPPEPPLEHGGVWVAVRELPRRQAQVVALHYVYDLKLADIASTLGVSEGTVKTLLHRARATLADRLDRDEEEVSR
jgi:RNA polymerase sigma-70 factor (ECF subfamily)